MTLYAYQLPALAAGQAEQVTDADIRYIRRRSGHSALRICIPLFTGIMLVSSLFLWMSEREFPLFQILALVFLFIPLSVKVLKEKQISACYAIVTEKNERWAEAKSRYEINLSGIDIPYETTHEINADMPKSGLFRTICRLHFCTVEIDGQIFAHVRCDEREYKRIQVGDKVIITDAKYAIPSVFARK